VFITFEGIEGCGKTTQIGLLAQRLSEEGRDFISTREPGGSPIGQDIRRLLLEVESHVSARTELLLYAAERAEHLDKVVRPALDQNRIVLCDRFGDATRAYQTFGRGLPRREVEEAHTIATGGLEPDLTVLLRLPVEVSLERARSRVALHGEGRFEGEALSFHRRVAEGYERLLGEFPDRIHAVDAEGSTGDVALRIQSLLEASHVFS
jgi:dTMP kinase